MAAWRRRRPRSWPSAGWLDRDAGKPFVARLEAPGYDAESAAENISAGTTRWPRRFRAGAMPAAPRQYAAQGRSRMGIAAVYTPSSKYKVYWALIPAEPEDK